MDRHYLPIVTTFYYSYNRVAAAPYNFPTGLPVQHQQLKRRKKLPEKTRQKSKIIRCKQIIPAVPGQQAMDNACIVCHDNTIVEVGPYRTLKKKYSAATTDLGQVTITPGLINAHSHLNLSGLYNKTRDGEGFIPWLLSLLANDYRTTDFSSVKKAAISAQQQGTCCFGDILSGHNLHLTDILDELQLHYTCFYEAFGFPHADAQHPSIPYRTTPLQRISGAGHALHTTDPDCLRVIKRQTRARNLPFSIHLAEHQDEMTMLMGEKNSFYNLLKDRELLGNTYRPPMKTAVEYARDLGILDAATLAVHCVHISDKDLNILLKSGTNICLCPRSNLFIDVGRAPMEKIIDSGISVSLATDSLASNHDLNLWNELFHFLKTIERDFTLEEAVQLLTINPARALLMDRELGSFEKGKIFRYGVVPEEIVTYFEKK